MENKIKDIVKELGLKKITDQEIIDTFDRKIRVPLINEENPEIKYYKEASEGVYLYSENSLKFYLEMQYNPKITK